MGKHQLSGISLKAMVLVGIGIFSLFGCKTCQNHLSRSRFDSSPAQPHQTTGDPTAISSVPAVGCGDRSEFPWPNQGSDGQLAERFLELAESLSNVDDPRSTDYFFQATVHSWQAMSEQPSCTGSELCHWSTYHDSLVGLVTEASRFGRFDRGNLRVYQPDGPHDIAMVDTSLPWPSDQFSDLRIPNVSKHRNLKHYYSAPGVGLPVVAIRNSTVDSREDPVEQFFPPHLPVAATALLRPRQRLAEHSTTETCGEFVLELANPLHVGSIQVNQKELPIARDISAPIEHHLEASPSNPLTGFILPGSQTRDDGLRWLEPYQRGKIPVVFVHGLLSDPSTWLEMVNYLRTQDWFNSRYQVWGFSYATGSPFVTSAHRLRNQLREAVIMIDPNSQDAALGKMVLIGHSMGGLVSKLQVSNSGEAMWNSISKVPLESIQASEEVRQQLAQRLYFAPLPFVSRVVYIATPHAGSSLAVRGIGRVSSALVRPEEKNRALHQQLVDDNPDAFMGMFQRRIPTSIDLLDPNDATLQAIYGLPVQSGTTQHTIVGTGTWLWTWGQSDGVVRVDSASHPDSVVEAHIAAAHTEITKDDATIVEVARILKLHLE